jgi:putative phosphoesterase
MKVALLGDVHANLPALEAVLAHARQQGAEALWNIGDFVGYGAFPEQSVQLLRKEGALSVVGNYDLKVLDFPQKKKKWKRSKRTEKYLAFRWAYDNLSEESRRYLGSLPREIRLEVEGRRVLLIHASPASIEEHLYPDTTTDRLRELAHLAEADMIIFGHSHRAFARQVDGVWFINTGSVGRPDDGDPRACYAFLRIEAESLEVRHFRVAYDVERAVAAIRANGLPRAFAQMMRQGYDLDTVLERRNL